jgi:hypothetical protein
MTPKLVHLGNSEPHAGAERLTSFCQILRGVLPGRMRPSSTMPTKPPMLSRVPAAEERPKRIK